MPWCDACICVGERSAVSRDLLECLRRRIDEAARHAKAAHSKLLRRNAHVRDRRCAGVAADAQSILPRLCVEIDADERAPFLTSFIVIERQLLPEHAPRDLLVAPDAVNIDTRDIAGAQR